MSDYDTVLSDFIIHPIHIEQCKKQTNSTPNNKPPRYRSKFHVNAKTCTEDAYNAWCAQYEKSQQIQPEQPNMETENVHISAFTPVARSFQNRNQTTVKKLNESSILLLERAMELKRRFFHS